MKTLKGFTLLELMITVAVLGVIIAIAAPSFADYLQRQSIRANTQGVLKTFSNARVQATTIDLSEATVCWNLGNADINISDGTTTHVLPAGFVGAYEGSNVAPSSLGVEISRTEFAADTTLLFDTEADNCITFDAQGRLSNAATTPLAMTFCRGNADTTDALRLEVQPSGRISTKLNTDTTGAGSQTCS